jgi:hypothetical protein
MLSRELARIRGVRPLPPQPALTRDTLYNYVFQYRPEGSPVSRDLFAAALDAEGIPCDGRFYEPVYRSDLFYPDPAVCPQLRLERDTPVDYAAVRCPVSERAAYHESVWLPQFLLIGGDDDVEDIIAAVAKVMDNLADLAGADPSLAGLKSMSRAERPKREREKNY